mgnify:CR=1 FL=1
MRQDQFTTRFQELLGEAQSMAVERSQQYIDPLHLLLAVLKDTEGTGRTLLERSGVRVRELERKVKEAIGKLPEVSGAADNVQRQMCIRDRASVTPHVLRKRKASINRA